MAGRRYDGDPGRMKPPRPRRERLGALVLPEALDVTCCSARLIGNRCVMVENHRGLCALGQEKIVVRTECGLLGICGCGLTLSEVRPDAMVVQGTITGVGYLEDNHA